MLSSTGAERVAVWADENLHPFGGIALVGAIATIYLAMLAWAWQHTSYDVWGALLVAPVMIALTVPIARRVAHDERDPTIVRLIMTALVVKMFMTLVRYAVAFGVYGGNADAGVYHNAGRELAQLYRNGNFAVADASSSGASFIKVVTGFVYVIIGPTKLGGFLLFSWIGFGGLYLMYRAFRLGVPDGNHRRYARLIFFLPSMTFWPSSIGKEAWMCFVLGVAAYGIARVLAARRGGFLIAGLGLIGAGFVRPHVALIIFVGFAIAYLIRRRERTTSIIGPISKVAGILLLVATGVVLLNRVQGYFGVTDLEQGGTTEVLEIAEKRTDEGGSSFKTVAPTSPRRFAYAVLTVLYRPLPQDGGNVQSMIAALEGTFMLLITLASAPRLLHPFRDPRRSGYAWMALTYTLLFCYAFASIGNFGILTRQRVQVMPFLLVLICLPTPAEVTAARNVESLNRQRPAVAS